MTPTRPDPHASYREHVSSEAEAVEEEIDLLERIVTQISICKYAGSHYDKQVVAVLEPAKADIESLRAQLATKEQYLSEWKALADKLEDGHRRMVIRTGEAEAQLATARKALEGCRDFKITDSRGKDVPEDSLHEIRKIARAALNSGEQK